jgi:DNA-binding beta-propeller fold protein YncE
MKIRQPLICLFCCLTAFPVSQALSADTKPVDAATAAKATAAQKLADDAFAKQVAAEKALLAAQGKLKVASQGVAKAKAHSVKATSDVAAAEKTLSEKTAAVGKAADALKPFKAQMQELARSAAKEVGNTQGVSDSALLEAQVAVNNANAVWQAAQTAAAKAPGDAAFDLLRTTAEKVVDQKQAQLRDLQSRRDAIQKSSKTAAALKELEAKHAPLLKAMVEADKARKEAEKALMDAKGHLPAVTAPIKQAEATYDKAKKEVELASAALATAQMDATKTLKSAEEALASTGKLVLFSKHVAPVFVKRCTACHNAQVAKGRYNMDTFAGVMKGGEQGDTVIPKDAETSNLVEVLENGSMPKDADPLSKSEIAMVKQWILNGARLDAGLKPEAALASIIPKEAQPLPPKVYRVPVPITAVAFSPDGQLVAASGYHEVILWNPAKGTEVRRISNVAERTYDIEFSADGKILAVAAGTPGQMGEVKLFNPATGELIKDLTTTNDAIFGVSFSPDGKRLATCSADRSIRVFNTATYAQELLIEDHADWVMDINWSPDGKKLVSASRDKTSKLFDAKTGESLITFAGHGDVVYGAVFAADNKQILSCGRDSKVRVWNPENGKPIREIAGFTGEVYRVICTPDGRVFSCSTDKQVREHKLADGSQVRVFAGHSDWVYSLTYHAGTKHLASGSWDGEIRLWNANDAKSLQHFVGAPGYATPAATASAK